MLISKPLVVYSIAKLRKRAKAAGVNQNTVSTTL
jgi:hypothetical protein